MEHNTRHTGIYGEDLACDYLERKGYRIIARNYHGGKCELDIIAEIENIIIFCEVKTARSEACGSPLGWISKTKIRHIASAAREYMVTHQIAERTLRFDVIGIEMREGYPEFTHIENAFWAPPDI